MLLSVENDLEAMLRRARAEGFQAAVYAAESRVHYLTARDTLTPHIRALKDEGADYAVARILKDRKDAR